MKNWIAGALGVAAIVAGAASFSTPAAALGGCGPNGHRGPYGHCRLGGQNQAWCLRHTGHGATPGPNGTAWCHH